jgi:hypothetical protein
VKKRIDERPLVWGRSIGGRAAAPNTDDGCVSVKGETSGVWMIDDTQPVDDVVEEVIYVTDMDAAFAVAGPVRKAAYGTDAPACASTIAAIVRLAFPQQLV